MKVLLKDKELDKKQEQHIEELIKKYRKYLNALDDLLFEDRGIHLNRPQLGYITLSLEHTLHSNMDKSNKELGILMSVAVTKAVCEILCIEIPDEVEIDDETLEVIR